ncbi:hypothetical protein FNF27_07194 [Cafeteria roenbergensis]|uniref:OBG-type G domain-containing protein n=1 Tax=Cafeteria roenbergensis TaxID=33653 RepID=A0A5A8CJK6_CAFRO|nr:hypothetical protein FNF31_06578 [Cafeteria roenbergensis]KAA0154885.1 hypothetical protein FNF29_02026 [Cafeteria roenbergensis]KAA0162681.1 hypothetical protein FNF28_04624 [Cafeteria roenbergensis]KAA0168225.1 hypothetical protein FNF27_07194 [Cafeteria roenbergensis]|eukprot:KAA0154885.1 hypothetical protein FNF29_02026 [Cafeteria roenbergensis]
MSTEEKIKDIEAEMAKTQKNKATAKHLGLLKAKLAKLKTELVSGGKGGGGGAGEGFDVSKSGDTRVGLVGFPSVGKSTLLSQLTGTESLAAAYEFTTLTAIPGNLFYRGAKLQIVDLPGIIEGAKDGKGRGRQVIAAARTCNMLLIVLDASKPITLKKKLEYELEGFGVRVNKVKPEIRFHKKDRGGVTFRSLHPQRYIDDDIVRSVCSEYKVPNADIEVRFPHCTVDQIIDAISNRAVYMPVVYVLNKIDALPLPEIELLCSYRHFVPISARTAWNFDELKERIWEYCKMLRIYTKPKGEIPDFDSPIILHARKPRISDLCDRIHRTLIEQYKFAWVWGSSVKHQPQKVGKDHFLHDEDVVQIVKNNG